MSMTTTTTTIRNIPTGVWLLRVVLLLVTTAQVNAVVSVNPPDAGDSSGNVLSTRIITDDGEPIGSAWQTFGDLPGGDTVLNPDGHVNGDGEPAVLVGSIADELDPYLLFDPADGSVHLLYWVHDAGPRVMHKQAPADLSGWSPATQVSGLGEIAVRPAAVFMAGTLKVVYERHDLGYGSTPRRIVLATSVGSGFTTESVGVTAEAAPNWPEVHALE